MCNSNCIKVEKRQDEISFEESKGKRLCFPQMKTKKICKLGLGTVYVRYSVGKKMSGVYYKGYQEDSEMLKKYLKGENKWMRTVEARTIL